MPVFTHRSELPYPASRVFAWHMRPGAFDRLTPPYEDVRVVERTGGPQDEGTVTLSVKKAGMRLRWVLRHTDFEPALPPGR
jgi:ligand-binding SRPBCC domain-containing protein